jgi:ribosomal protein S13
MAHKEKPKRGQRTKTHKSTAKKPVSKPKNKK